MASPRYTVIIPTRHFDAEEPVLASLRRTFPADGPLQILVAEGDHPARQRNDALELAQGEIIVFLDDDCQLGADYWTELAAAFQRPEVEIVGGPARLRPDATAQEEIFQALLTHPLIVGPIAARYAPRGEFRPTTQRELILCNLAVRRSVFTKIGSLSTRLFPNEENEWLDRAQIAGVGLYYLPSLQVCRPQREAWKQLAVMLLRYGMGRTRQLVVSGGRFTLHQLLPLLLIPVVWAAGSGFRYDLAILLLWLAVSFLVASTLKGNLPKWERAVAGLASPLVPLAYAVGQVAGWFALLVPQPPATRGIIIRNERGEIQSAPI